jgi:hypothetical protein
MNLRYKKSKLTKSRLWLTPEQVKSRNSSKSSTNRSYKRRLKPWHCRQQQINQSASLNKLTQTRHRAQLSKHPRMPQIPPTRAQSSTRTPKLRNLPLHQLNTTKLMTLTPASHSPRQPWCQSQQQINQSASLNKLTQTRHRAQLSKHPRMPQISPTRAQSSTRTPQLRNPPLHQLNTTKLMTLTPASLSPRQPWHQSLQQQYPLRNHPMQSLPIHIAAMVTRSRWMKSLLSICMTSKVQSTPSKVTRALSVTTVSTTNYQMAVDSCK